MAHRHTHTLIINIKKFLHFRIFDYYFVNLTDNNLDEAFLSNISLLINISQIRFNVVEKIVFTRSLHVPISLYNQICYHNL